MAKLGYAYQGKAAEKIVRAQGCDLTISPKESYEVANTLRGMNVIAAKKLLEQVIALKTPIAYKRYIHRSGIGHRKGHFGPGRYPVNTSEEFIKMLNLLQANAKFKGMNENELVLMHVATHKGAPRIHSFKGSPHNTKTTHIEIIAKEQSAELKPKLEAKKEGAKK